MKLAMRACVLPRHKTSKKTGEPRIIPLTDEGLAVIRDTPQVGEYVFLSRFNKPYTVQGLRSIVAKHLGMTTYDLRHTFAQAGIDAGEHPEIVTKVLGHKTSRMVWTYARIRDEQMVEAASHLWLRRVSG